MNRLDCGESLAKKYFAGKICMARYVSGAKNIWNWQLENANFL